MNDFELSGCEMPTFLPSGIVVTLPVKSQLQEQDRWRCGFLQAKLLEHKRQNAPSSTALKKADGGSWVAARCAFLCAACISDGQDLRTESRGRLNPAAVLDGDLDGFLEARGSGGAIDVMTTNGTVLATSIAQHWHNFWRGEIGDWIATGALRIVMLLVLSGAGGRRDLAPPG